MDFRTRGDGSGGDEGEGGGGWEEAGVVVRVCAGGGGGGEVELWCGFFWWYGRWKGGDLWAFDG